jgi:hypothetical protein
MWRKKDKDREMRLWILCQRKLLLRLGRHHEKLRRKMPLHQHYRVERLQGTYRQRVLLLKIRREMRRLRLLLMLKVLHLPSMRQRVNMERTTLKEARKLRKDHAKDSVAFIPMIPFLDFYPMQTIPLDQAQTPLLSIHRTTPLLPNPLLHTVSKQDL